MRKINLNLVFIGYLILEIGLLVFILAPGASAQGVMNNSFYRLQMGNLNSIAGETSGSEYNLSITSGETSPGLYSDTNVKVKAGFQYVPRGGVFSFSISNKLIDFGTLVPTNPVKRRITLTVSNTNAPGYQVVASENHQLKNDKNQAVIPDTTCDNGNCTQFLASDWESALTYGFGYRCDNVSVLSNNQKVDSCIIDDLTFSSNQKAHKQFADASKEETEVLIMKGERGRNQKTHITYKVNIPTSQPTGSYVNSVTYIATATF